MSGCVRCGSGISWGQPGLDGGSTPPRRTIDDDAEGNFPIDPEIAHQTVRDHLEGSNSGITVHDPKLAAGLCLRSSNPSYRKDGAALLAEIGDNHSTDITPVLYDLAAALDAADAKTRAYVVGTFRIAAGMVPRTASELLDDIVPRLEDSDPLVREAACSTVASIAHDYACDSWEGISENERVHFRNAIDSLWT